jgi:hypothetical protein
MMEIQLLIGYAVGTTRSPMGNLRAYGIRTSTASQLVSRPRVSEPAENDSVLDMSPEGVLPPGLLPRGLTRERASAFVGLSPAAFDKARSEGKYPGPTLPGGRYDLVLLQASMDRLSGLIPEGEATSPLDAWRDTRRAR